MKRNTINCKQIIIEPDGREASTIIHFSGLTAARRLLSLMARAINKDRRVIVDGGILKDGSRGVVAVDTLCDGSKYKFIFSGTITEDLF